MTALATVLPFFGVFGIILGIVLVTAYKIKQHNTKIKSKTNINHAGDKTNINHVGDKTNINHAGGSGGVEMTSQAIYMEK